MELQTILDEVKKDLDNGQFNLICSNETNFRKYVYSKIFSAYKMKNIPDRALLTKKYKIAYLVVLDDFGGELFWDEDKAKKFMNNFRNKKLKIVKVKIVK
jgi:hypothetical protein